MHGILSNEHEIELFFDDKRNGRYDFFVEASIGQKYLDCGVMRDRRMSSYIIHLSSNSRFRLLMGILLGLFAPCHLSYQDMHTPVAFLNDRGMLHL